MKKKKLCSSKRVIKFRSEQGAKSFSGFCFECWATLAQAIFVMCEEAKLKTFRSAPYHSYTSDDASSLLTKRYLIKLLNYGVAGESWKEECFDSWKGWADEAAQIWKIEFQLCLAVFMRHVKSCGKFCF